MKILCFGSLNLDHVYQVDHHVRAGETLACLGLAQYPGGKGLNQSIALSRAGADVWHAGQIGPDGECLVSLLKENGVKCNFIRMSQEHTGHTVIQVDAQGQNCILLYGGANRCIEEGWMEEVLSHFEKGDILLLQNEINSLPFLMEQAARRGMQIALNPSPIDGEVACLPLDTVRWFLLNELEGEALSGEREPGCICEQLLEKYPNAEVVLTLGESGVRYQSKRQTLVKSSYQVPVVDTTAAGDTFTGYFLAQVSKGKTVAQALECASKASALAVTRAGAAPSIPMMQEVEQADLPVRKPGVLQEKGDFDGDN